MGEEFTDGGLIDVSGLSMDVLLAEVRGSSLGQALDRILAADPDDVYSSFNASI